VFLEMELIFLVPYSKPHIFNLYDARTCLFCVPLLSVRALACSAFLCFRSFSTRFGSLFFQSEGERSSPYKNTLCEHLCFFAPRNNQALCRFKHPYSFRGHGAAKPNDGAESSSNVAAQSIFENEEEDKCSSNHTTSHPRN